MHADGKVLIEGTQGITIDARTRDLTLKASSVKVTAIERRAAGQAAAVRCR